MTDQDISITKQALRIRTAIWDILATIPDTTLVGANRGANEGAPSDAQPGWVGLVAAIAAIDWDDAQATIAAMIDDAGESYDASKPVPEVDRLASDYASGIYAMFPQV